MSDDDEDQVGYKRPPKQYQFKKGRSGNCKGRPRKPVAPTTDDSLAAILERAANEKIVVNGAEMTLLEVEIRSIQRLAVKPNIAASNYLNKLRREAGIGVAKLPGGGVLVVPGTVPLDEWTLAAARQQAQFRHSKGGGSADEE